MDKNKATQYSLDINVLRNLPFDKYNKDFTFIVNDKEYKTSRIIADILSPQIRKFHLADGTIDTFTIDTKEISDKHDFSEILSLISFNPREIKEEDIDYYRQIFLLLGNEQECLNLCTNYSDEISINNVFELIRQKTKFKDSPASIAAKEIEFISSHFYEIDRSEFKKFKIEIIEEVVKNDKLKIENEDSLLKFIIEIYSENPSYSTT